MFRFRAPHAILQGRDGLSSPPRAMPFGYLLLLPAAQAYSIVTSRTSVPSVSPRTAVMACRAQPSPTQASWSSQLNIGVVKGVVRRTNRDGITVQLDQLVATASGGGAQGSVCADDHTKMSIRCFNSTRYVRSGLCVPCLSVVGIEVDSAHRREGRARTALTTLIQAAFERRHILIVENVVSPHMHALIGELDGEAILGSRPGARGCHYWLPPRPHTCWQDMALPISR